MKTLHFYDSLSGAFTRTKTITEADMVPDERGPWRLPDHCTETAPPAKLGAREFAVMREGAWRVCTLPDATKLPEPLPDMSPKLTRKGA